MTPPPFGQYITEVGDAALISSRPWQTIFHERAIYAPTFARGRTQGDQRCLPVWMYLPQKCAALAECCCTRFARGSPGCGRILQGTQEVQDPLFVGSRQMVESLYHP